MPPSDQAPSTPVMTRAIFYCNLPPPVTGQTVGTQVVVDMLSGDLEIVCLNTSDDRMSIGRGPMALLRRAVSMLSHGRALRRELRRRPTDVLYFVVSSSHLGQLRDALTVGLSRRRSRRIVAHVRSGNYHENFGRVGLGALSSFVVRRLDGLIFLSGHLADRAARFVPDAKRRVVFNTIDSAVQLTAEEARAKIERRRGRDRLRIVYISNMIPSKGYLDLARALTLLADGPPLVADFVGHWPSASARDEFERFVRDHGLESSVRIHGGVSDRARIRELLVEADAFVLPTYFPVEAQPRSIIEALNAAVPVVATRHASIPEYVFDGDNGYLVDKQSPEQIAEALRRLADPEEWRERATAARRSYDQQFDPEILRRRLLEVFVGDA